MRVRTHPGEVLRCEFLEPLGLSARALAEAIGVPANRISDIVREHRGVTADTALRLAKHFDTSPEFWMNLQSAYDLSLALKWNATHLAAHDENASAARIMRKSDSGKFEPGSRDDRHVKEMAASVLSNRQSKATSSSSKKSKHK